ncbi:MAG: penicillin-binding protein 2 [Candidatus Cloacimonadota bacterium]|nr:penicillin-binding protein 2 [Candidatus Cloacimonadota bacterium]
MNISKGRIYVVIFFVLIVFSAIIWRLYAVQIRDIYGFCDRYYRYKPNRQIIPADRGIIYDRNGIPLAGNEKTFTLQFCPSIMDCAQADSLSAEDSLQIYRWIASAISESTSADFNVIYNRLKKFSHDYPNGFELIRDVDVLQKNSIKSTLAKNKVNGLQEFKQKSKRIYPKEELAGAVIGLYKEEEAKCGIEYVFDDDLSGEDGWYEFIRYATGEKYRTTDMKEKKQIPGNSVYLTIDSHVQTILEKYLKEGLIETKSKHALGIIVSVTSGDILGISGISADYLNVSTHASHSIPLYPVSWLFEPGSIVKPIVMLMALEENKFAHDHIFDCNTRWIGKRKIVDVKELDDLTMKGVIAHSSNVGMSYIADELSDEYIHDRLMDFGFGHKTGILLTGEQSGVVPKTSQWSGFTKHSLAFGQEISVTAIQMVYAYAAIANGGKMLQPRILEKVTDYQGNLIHEPQKKIIREMSNKQDLDTLKTYLSAVVTEGHGFVLKDMDIKIAGKTGTAEKFENGKLKERKYVSSFCGFFPIQNPKFAMLIIMDEPYNENTTHEFGSYTACPVYKKIVRELIVLPNLDIFENEDFGYAMN